MAVIVLGDKVTEIPQPVGPISPRGYMSPQALEVNGRFPFYGMPMRADDSEEVILTFEDEDLYPSDFMSHGDPIALSLNTKKGGGDPPPPPPPPVYMHKFQLRLYVILSVPFYGTWNQYSESVYFEIPANGGSKTFSFPGADGGIVEICPRNYMGFNTDCEARCPNISTGTGTITVINGVMGGTLACFGNGKSASLIISTWPKTVSTGTIRCLNGSYNHQLTGLQALYRGTMI